MEVSSGGSFSDFLQYDLRAFNKLLGWPVATYNTIVACEEYALFIANLLCGENTYAAEE